MPMTGNEIQAELDKIEGLTERDRIICTELRCLPNDVETLEGGFVKHKDSKAIFLFDRVTKTVVRVR